LRLILCRSTTQRRAHRRHHTRTVRTHTHYTRAYRISPAYGTASKTGRISFLQSRSRLSVAALSFPLPFAAPTSNLAPRHSSSTQKQTTQAVSATASAPINLLVQPSAHCLSTHPLRLPSCVTANAADSLPAVTFPRSQAPHTTPPPPPTLNTTHPCQSAQRLISLTSTKPYSRSLAQPPKIRR